VTHSLYARSGRNAVAPLDTAHADAVNVLCNEAFALHGAGQLAEAVDRYQQILLLKDIPVIRNNLGHALAEQGQFDAAIAQYRRAVELKPDYPEALCNWGGALSRLDRIDDAEAKFRRAIAVNPRLAGAHHNLAVVLKERGQLDDARRAAQRAIKLAPRNTAYYEHLAALRPFAAGDRYVRGLEDLAKDCAKLSAAEQAHLHFALARAYQDTGRFEDAFVQWLAGNRAKRGQIAYDEAAELGLMDRVRAQFAPEFMHARKGAGDPSRLPVFIVGMPRSGTTLIEQILASHPQVFGAGELDLFEQTVHEIRGAMPAPRLFPEMAPDLSADLCHVLGARYRRKLAERAPQAARITDKMPGNFLFAGLIHLSLPNAIIIHATRDPLDTCVSCFSTLFSRGQTYSYDLAELGRYYRQYRALMAHWHHVLPPGRILDVRYEDLVDDLAGAARRIVAHCGLAWDARCLDFHRTERPVRTASASQVRKPVYKSSVGRWLRYERFLAPLLAGLEGKDATAPIASKSCNIMENMHA
jgi:hypothetical protein